MSFQYATSQFPAGGSRKVDELLECGYHKVKGNLTTLITIWHGLEIMTALTASTKTSIICMVKVGSSSSNDYFLGAWIRLPYSIKREHCSCFNGNEAVLACEGEHTGVRMLAKARHHYEWWGKSMVVWFQSEAVIDDTKEMVKPSFDEGVFSGCGTRQDIWPPCTPLSLSSTPNPDMSFS